jgi:hypothetical protein
MEESLPVKGAGKNKGRGWHRSGYFAGGYDGQEEEAAGDENNTTGMRTTVKEPTLGIVMSPV